MKRNFKKALIIFAIFIIIFLAGCQSKNNNTTQDTTSTTLAQQPVQIDANGNSQQGQQKVVKISMVANNFKFDPDTVTVNKGDHVILTIKSIDVNHGIAIPEFGVSQPINAGQTVTVEFNADKTGTFSFFCNVFCGSGHKSMRGSLIVK